MVQEGTPAGESPHEQADRIIHHADRLVWALWARDEATALPLAKDLRTMLDVVIHDMTMASIATPLTPMQKAKRDLDRILATVAKRKAGER